MIWERNKYWVDANTLEVVPLLAFVALDHVITVIGSSTKAVEFDRFNALSYLHQAIGD